MSGGRRRIDAIVDWARPRRSSSISTSADAKVAVLDVDIVFIFPDGGKLILPGLAFALVALDAPSMVAEEGASMASIFSRLSATRGSPTRCRTIRLTDMEQKAVPTDEKTDEPTDSAAASADGVPAPPPMPIKVVLPQIEDVGRYNEEAPVPIHMARSENFTTNDTASAPPSRPQREDGGSGAAPASAGRNPGFACHGQAPRGRRADTFDAAGRWRAHQRRFRGTSGRHRCELRHQSAPEDLQGTSRTDVIHADDFDKAPPGTSLRVVDLTVAPPTVDAIATGMTITGVPDGVAILGATKTADGYHLEMAPSDPNHAQLLLVYTLPGDGAKPDATGLYGQFVLTSSSTSQTPTGETGELHGNAAFRRRRRRVRRRRLSRRSSHEGNARRPVLDAAGQHHRCRRRR